MSDRVAIFNQAVIQRIGSPREVYEYPRASFVANLIGENNNLHGVIAAADGGRRGVTLETGETITATPVGLGAAAARTTVSVSPERILPRPGDSRGNTHRIRAEVIEVIYSGDEPALGWDPAFRRALDLHG